jgi:hypothetical protein
MEQIKDETLKSDIYRQSMNKKIVNQVQIFDSESII